MRDLEHPVKSDSLCHEFYYKLLHQSFNVLNSKSVIVRGSQEQINTFVMGEREFIECIAEGTGAIYSENLARMYIYMNVRVSVCACVRVCVCACV